MKGVILASLVSAAYAVAVLILFRLRRSKNRAGTMFKVYVGSLPVLAVLFATTPADLGFLSPWSMEPNAWLDGAYSLFIYSASVLGGWLQLYNLAERGLSLRILIDANERQDGVVDVDYVCRSYGAGKGIAWMYDKRLSDLLRLGLVAIHDSGLALTEKGERYAALLKLLRRLFSIGTAGTPRRAC